MRTTEGRPDLERLRLVVGGIFGFAFEGDRLEQLEGAARVRQTELGIADVDAYTEYLRTEANRAEPIALAEMLTVTETFFYRNADQIRALIEEVLPACARRNGRRLRILSAGCASGEEPYSLAIALREALPDVDTWNIDILGIDINRSMLAKASRARYTPWSLRATPEAIRERYFRQDAGEIALDEQVKKMVRFRAHNLIEPDPHIFCGLAYDVIFCRNVIMYFTPEVMRSVVARLTESLVSGGWLFLGHAETLRGVSHEYHLCHTHDTFYYRRQERDGSVQEFANEASALSRAELDVLPSLVDDTTSWFEAIQRATRNIAELSRSTSSAAVHPSDSPPGTARAHANHHSVLAPVLELMQRERFAEARVLLEKLPSDMSRHPDALLFSAVLFTNDGRLSDAEYACERLLEVDDLNAGAHYVKALCREHAGDSGGAAEQDRIAAHLDPTFAMPHLHAGLLAKHAGDALLTRRELGQALMLLESEDTSRLALFGGGFSREALVMLCRAELAKMGGIE